MLLQWIVIQTKTYRNLDVEAEVTISSFFIFYSVTYLLFPSQTVTILRLLHIFRVLLISALAKQPPKQWKISSLMTIIEVGDESKIR